MPPRRRLAAAGNGDEPAPKRNTQADREFIAANLDEFMVIDGSLVWSGKAEDIGSPYQLPPANLRCVRSRQIRDDEGGAVLDNQMRPLKDRCPRWAMVGTDICVDHAKGSKVVMDEVRKRIVGAADAITGAMMSIAFNKNAADADRIKAMNSLLDRGGLKAGVEISADEDSWGRLYDRISGKVTDEEE